MDVKKILIIRNDKIGDLVLSTGAINLLKKHFRAATIDIVVSKENKSLIEKDRRIRKVFVLNFSPRKFRDFKEYSRLSRKLRAEKYDLGIDLRGSFFNIFFLLFFGNIKYKIGFYTNFFSKLFLDFSKYKDFKGPASLSMVKMLNEALETNYSDIWPKIDADNKDRKELAVFLKKYNVKKSISICVDASNESKQLPLEEYDKFIKKIHENFPKHKIFLIGINEKILSNLWEKNKHCTKLFKRDLRFIFLFFERNNLVVAPDGGLMHLAWAAKSNLIALIPPNILEDTRPLGQNSYIIKKEVKKIKAEELIKISNTILKN